MSSINIRVDDDIKAQAQELFASLGMDMSTAMNIFLRQAIAFGGIPFTIRQPRYNNETEQAMFEAHNGINLSKPYSSVSELREALNADDQDP